MKQDAPLAQAAPLAPESAAGPVKARYEGLVASGAIERDPAQLRLVRNLDDLVAALAARRRPRKSSPLGWLFAKPEAPLPKGLYIWGSVGRGKTMLMDLFFQSLTVRRKRRVHFHAYMADVHERIHDWRQALKRGEVAGDDPIRPGPKASRGKRGCYASTSSRWSTSPTP